MGTEVLYEFNYSSQRKLAVLSKMNSGLKLKLRTCTHRSLTGHIFQRVSEGASCQKKNDALRRLKIPWNNVLSFASLNGLGRCKSIEAFGHSHTTCWHIRAKVAGVVCRCSVKSHPSQMSLYIFSKLSFVCANRRYMPNDIHTCQVMTLTMIHPHLSL
jgi:hypothetical protein